MVGTGQTTAAEASRLHAERAAVFLDKDIGGGRYSNCSMLEAIEKCQSLTGREQRWSYSEANRAGDHIWWISDIRRFQTHYPGWSMRYDIDAILGEIFDSVTNRAARSEVT